MNGKIRFQLFVEQIRLPKNFNTCTSTTVGDFLQYFPIEKFSVLIEQDKRNVYFYLMLIIIVILMVNENI